MHPHWHCRPAIAVPLLSTKQRFSKYLFLVVLLVGGTFTLSYANDTLVVSIKSKHHTHKLSKCNHPYTFLSNTLSSQYKDRNTRNAIYTICPRYPQQRISVSFQSFDLALGDTLFAYDGYNTEAPLLGFATGQGIQAAFGGEIFVSYSRVNNPTSCITFLFHTNGDEIAGEGWEAIVQCVERNLEITIPHITPQQFVCDPSYVVVPISPAQIISTSGPIPNDSTLVLIKDGNTGEVCGEATTSYNANSNISHIFGPGSYVVEYISLLDDSVRGTTSFEVSPPPLECKATTTLTVGSDDKLAIAIDQLINNYCPPQHNIFQYNVIVRDRVGNFIIHGNTLDGLPNFPLDKMSVCSNESYFVEIQKEYTNSSNTLICNSDRLVQSCVVEIKLADQVAPTFVEPPKAYTLVACEYDLLEVLSTLPIPTVTNACGQVVVEIESALLLENTATCNDPSTFLITWSATGDRGNSINHFDTLHVVRPTITLLTPAEDLSLYCPSDISNLPIESTSRPAVVSGITINGVFQSMDTQFLSTAETVCDYQLILKDNSQTNSCGKDIIRYWSVIDVCANPNITTPLDTQTIQIIDTLAPIISCTDATSLGTAQVFTLPANNCQVIPDFPLPTVTDDCDANPIVREYTLETLANGEWSPRTISLISTPLGVGTYRVSYEATDACGNTSTNATCYRYFSIEDTVSPIANCQQNISIQLDANGTATLPAAALNNGSSDNCGIANLFIKRSACSDNSFQMEASEYAATIDFSCCDAASSIQIDLLVVDNAGNSSTCSTIIDQLTMDSNPSGMGFVDPAQTYTLLACDFDLLQTISMLPVPAVTGICGQSFAQIETATILNNNTQCNNQSDFVITWKATDNFGNTIRRFDTLKIERPSALQMMPSADITIRCEESSSTTTNFPINAPGLLTGIIINGQFEIIDTLFLSTDESVCDFQLVYEELFPSPTCKDQINRIWSITDLCINPNIKTPIDTQEIRLIDNSPPTIICNDFASIENAELLFLSTNNCDEVINFPLPRATDNCDTNPTVREVTVDLLLNQTWSSIGNSLSQTPIGPGIYRVGYEAIDGCGLTTNSIPCFRYFILEDSIPPVASCQENITIQLDENGLATLSAADVNNNSSDNCGIVSQLIRRSACGENDSTISESPSDSLNDYSASVQFDCCDAAGTIQVDLLVTDIAGNSSICSTIIEDLTIDNQGIAEFVEPAKTYTLIACDFDLQTTIATLPIPAVTDVCGLSAAQIETTTLLNTNAQCNNQSDFIITWQAADDFGNIIRRQDTLRVERPSAVQVTPSADISINCSDTPLDTTLLSINPARLLTGLIIDGQFQIFDSIFLSANESVCDYQLSFELENPSYNCGDTLIGIWSITDLCIDSSQSTPIDTQKIILINNSPTTISCNDIGSLENADTLFVAANGCEEVLAFPLPQATNNCNTNPTIREFTVDQLSNQVWFSIGSTLSQTPVSPGTYRVGYEAMDACSMTGNSVNCYRYFVLVDTIPPIARCQQNINIQLDQNGNATLSAAELNDGSFDNCGIEILLTKRSACQEGDQRANVEMHVEMHVENDTITGVNLNDWSASILFECCDLNGEVQLDLLVVDSFNNFNTCRTITKVSDLVLPTCTALAPATATCQEYEVTDLGRPTDINENNEFDEDEWLPLLPNQVSLFNTRFGNTISVCTDNATCSIPAIEQQYQLIEGTCGSISIKRRYRAVDFSGNASPWLEQLITVNYLPDWTLVLPADEMTNCEITKIEDPRSPIQNGVCDDLVWNFRDSIVRFENGSTKEICRIFNIVNRCIGNRDNQWLAIPRPTNDQGVVTSPVIVKAINYAMEDHLTYTQKIRIVDNEAPFLVLGEVELGIQGKGDVAPFGEEDQTLGAAPFECDEIKEFSVFARDCSEPSTGSLAYSWEFFQDDQLLDSGDRASFLQPVIPNTAYSVNWSVRDEFGNQSDTTVSYQFIDAGPPTTLCKKGVRAIIEVDSRDITITTDSLNAGSFDNCNDQIQISLFLWNESVTPDTPSTIEAILQLPTEIAFSCLDTGEVELFLYSTDQSGNFSYCSTSVEILENPDVDCKETMLDGMIVNRFGHPITGAEIQIVGKESNMETQSNEVGQYGQQLPLSDTYTIRPFLDKHPLNGISTYDIILISKHILGEQFFESPYQYIAADVNRSGSITIFDIVQLRQLILNQIHEFPNNDSWRFVNADFEFQTDQPLAEVFPEHYEYNATTPEHLNMDFIGVKIGDLNGNANTYNLSTAQSRQSQSTFFIHTNPMKVQKGKTYILPFYAPALEEIDGFQATFKFHDLILTNFEEGVVTSENVHGWRKNQEGFLTASWHSLLSHDNNTSELFTLTVEATKDGFLQELLEITSNPTPAEAYSLSGNRLGVALSIPNQMTNGLMSFGFTSTPLPHAEGVGLIPIPSVSGVFQLFQNHPNPFSETTTISFYLPEAALTALSVFDVHGRNILQTQQHYETGTHTITLDSDQMPIGTYFYQVATPFGVATKKMTIVR